MAEGAILPRCMWRPGPLVAFFLFSDYPSCSPRPVWFSRLSVWPLLPGHTEVGWRSLTDQCTESGGCRGPWDGRLGSQEGPAVPVQPWKEALRTHERRILLPGGELEREKLRLLKN